MTTPRCACPPVRWFLIETGTTREIDAHLGTCTAAQWPQTGRAAKYPRFGPREQCTCVRAADVPEYVHAWECRSTQPRKKPSWRGRSCIPAGVTAPG